MEQTNRRHLQQVQSPSHFDYFSPITFWVCGTQNEENERAINQFKSRGKGKNRKYLAKGQKVGQFGQRHFGQTPSHSIVRRPPIELPFEMNVYVCASLKPFPKFKALSRFSKTLMQRNEKLPSFTLPKWPFGETKKCPFRHSPL